MPSTVRPGIATTPVVGIALPAGVAVLGAGAVAVGVAIDPVSRCGRPAVPQHLAATDRIAVTPKGRDSVQTAGLSVTVRMNVRPLAH